ncbi:CD2-associated protein isoform X2 [Poeciliopsis prolifica]|uniref:CD2-associated protein isoform X2 n=1 Tax=Poeciliopsis prolifica TaxID=188132 RepID=UPI002413856D|nr:CD2-associated protein isoform X2 [Poeciliopsis prolifica]
MEVLVEFEYDALHDDELTLRPGDIIKNVRYIEEEGWMEGELNGRRGVFPDNFVKELKKDPKEVKETRNEPKEEPSQPQGRESSVANLVKRISVIGIPTGGFQPMPPAASKKPKRRQCKVQFDYQPVNEDELELKVGDIVDILEEVEEGWWSGSLNGKSGLFPSNFVKELEAAGEEAEANDTAADKPDGSGIEPPATPTSPQPDSGNGATHQPRRIIGVGFGDIFKGGPVKLRTQPSPITEDRKVKDQEKDKAGPAQPVPSLPSAAKPAHPNMTDSQRVEVDGKHKAPTAKEFCKVKYAYEGKNEDELSLKEGELVHILSKDTGEPGWWRGEVGGRDGVFPNNFVTIVPETEKEAAPPRGSMKSLAKPEVEEKLPRKPPPLASKPEPPAVERKSINFRPDERGDKHTPEPKLYKPPAPNPPKKPVPIPPKKPEKPIGPSLSMKHNGEVPSMRPKLDLEPPSIRPKLDLEPVLPTKPKTQPGEKGDKPADADLISFDDLSSASEKLSHLTTSRPKVTGRRLPGQFAGGQSPTKEVSAEKVFKVDEEESAKPKPTEHKKSSPLHQLGFAEPKPGPAAIATLDTSISQNSRAHPELAEQSAQQDELKSQIKDLLLSVELLKAQQMKEITELRRDLDEERVKRVALQIEVENLKKTIQST